MDDTRCKARVLGFWNVDGRCTRKAWRDGWCKQHHPDSVRARKEASKKRYDEQHKNHPWYKLEVAGNRIIELEQQLECARHELMRLRDVVCGEDSELIEGVLRDTAGATAHVRAVARNVEQIVGGSDSEVSHV